MATLNKRTEKDSLGEKEVLADACYGIYTARVLENFQITESIVPVLFLKNYIQVKKAYAVVNENNHKLDGKLSSAIVKACEKLLTEEEKFSEYFPIDVIQSGGGTSTNMMVNEVIANAANEILGGKKGEYKPIHPNDHVNMSQSSNDTFPGVTKLTTLVQMENLISEMEELKKEFLKKSKEFKGIEKVGRTHLQDALRIDAGDEFLAYVSTTEKNIKEMEHIKPLLLELPFGATALGSLQNVTEEIRKDISLELSKIYKQKFTMPQSYFEGTSSSGDVNKVSAAVDNFCVDFIKILNDVRFLASGPFGGINELSLPSVQAGSSIMPGKVNPSIAEAVEMTCFKIRGNHQTISLATLHAQLQLQAFMPIIAFTLFESLDILTKSVRTFVEKCLSGIEMRRDYVKRNLNESFVFATEYSEVLGYAKVSELVKKATKEKLSLRKLIEEELSKKS